MLLDIKGETLEPEPQASKGGDIVTTKPLAKH